MMNFQPQLLTKGRALCGKAFPNFVRTFNWLVDFCQNLKGDAQGGADGGGKITVDTADPAHPVIRCKGCSSSSSFSGGIATGAFQIDLADDGTVNSWTLTNCYWNVGGVTRSADTIDAVSGTDGFVYVLFDLTSSDGGTPTAGFAASLTDLEAQQKKYDKWCAVLYKAYPDPDDDTKTRVVDLRNAPQIQVFESDLEMSYS